MATTTTGTTAVPVSDRAARAHAQKNCLSIILAVASLVAPELSGASRQRLERLRAAAMRLTELLNDDLAEEEHTTSVDDIDVAQLFAAVCGALRDRADEVNVRLVVDCRGGRLRGVNEDLREVLFNLIANALEATPAGRTVHVRTCSTPDGGQRWTIHDAGEGMKREMIDQLGVPHRTSRPGGSGLGVAVAKEVVSRLGGSLRFESSEHGTIATILLPPSSGAQLSG